MVKNFEFKQFDTKRLFLGVMIVFPKFGEIPQKTEPILLLFFFH